MAAKFLVLCGMAAVLAMPAFAFADESPSPALAACRAEYQQLGATAFVAKYGTGDAGLHACLQAHGGTQSGETGKTEGPAAGIAAQLCELEYKKVGTIAFATKYGTGDAAKRACLQANAAQAQAIVASCKTLGKDGFERCVKQALAPANGDAKPKPKEGNGDVTGYVAQALCAAEASSLGRDAFVAKYGGGTEVFGACVKADLPKAQALLAPCKSSTGDAFKQCVMAALKSAGVH